MNTVSELDNFPGFSSAEYSRRYTAIREAMDKEQLDAALICGAPGSPEVRY
jgi:hypothetical protein